MKEVEETRKGSFIPNQRKLGQKWVPFLRIMKTMWRILGWDVATPLCREAPKDGQLSCFVRMVVINKRFILRLKQKCKHKKTRSLVVIAGRSPAGWYKEQTGRPKTRPRKTAGKMVKDADTWFRVAENRFEQKKGFMFFFCLAPDFKHICFFSGKCLFT